MVQQHVHLCCLLSFSFTSNNITAVLLLKDQHVLSIESCAVEELAFKGSESKRNCSRDFATR
mgnify:CR=1 FL=1